MNARYRRTFRTRRTSVSTCSCAKPGSQGAAIEDAIVGYLDAFDSCLQRVIPTRIVLTQESGGFLKSLGGSPNPRKRSFDSCVRASDCSVRCNRRTTARSSQAASRTTTTSFDKYAGAEPVRHRVGNTMSLLERRARTSATSKLFAAGGRYPRLDALPDAATQRSASLPLSGGFGSRRLAVDTRASQVCGIGSYLVSGGARCRALRVRAGLRVRAQW